MQHSIYDQKLKAARSAQIVKNPCSQQKKFLQARKVSVIIFFAGNLNFCSLKKSARGLKPLRKASNLILMEKKKQITKLIIVVLS